MYTVQTKNRLLFGHCGKAWSFMSMEFLDDGQLSKLFSTSFSGDGGTLLKVSSQLTSDLFLNPYRSQIKESLFHIFIILLRHYFTFLSFIVYIV